MSDLALHNSNALGQDPLSRIERGMAILKALDCLDDRAKMILSSAVLNQVAGSRENSQGEEMLSLSDGFLRYTDASAHEASKLALLHGKQVKAAYIQEVGNEPPTHAQLVNGRKCQVCDYSARFLENIADSLEQLLTEYRK